MNCEASLSRAFIRSTKLWIPDEAGPHIVEARLGEPTPINPNDDDTTRRAIQRENESAQILAGRGFDVVQNPVVAGPMNPDYLINGEVYDHYAPSTDSPRNIWSEVQGKVERGQTNNVVISLRTATCRRRLCAGNLKNGQLKV